MGERSRKAHRCGGREGMSVVSSKFNREEWVTKVICLGLRWMRCLGGMLGQESNSLGLVNEGKGQSFHHWAWTRLILGTGPV